MNVPTIKPGPCSGRRSSADRITCLGWRFSTSSTGAQPWHARRKQCSEREQGGVEPDDRREPVTLDSLTRHDGAKNEGCRPGAAHPAIVNAGSVPALVRRGGGQNQRIPKRGKGCQRRCLQ